VIVAVACHNVSWAMMTAPDAIVAVVLTASDADAASFAAIPAFTWSTTIVTGHSPQVLPPSIR
jgi:hypothetical protein